MSFFGLSESVFRFSSFVVIFLVMAGLEAFLPRRDRRQRRGGRWFTNLGILVADYVAIGLVTLVVPVTATLAALWAEAHGVGLFALFDWPDWMRWLVGFLILDFTIWAQHVATHKIPLLWRVHRVHHTDLDLDASSAVRFHPLEILLSVAVKSTVVLMIGAPPALVVVFEAIVNGSALFNHANVNLPGWLDRILRLLIVTPDMHRIHHSVINRETDSNYGFALSIWDRLFRVYNEMPEGGHEGMKIGLIEWQDDAPSRLGWALALPFRTPPPSGSGERAKSAAPTDQ